MCFLFFPLASFAEDLLSEAKILEILERTALRVHAGIPITQNSEALIDEMLELKTIHMLDTARSASYPYRVTGPLKDVKDSWSGAARQFYYNYAGRKGLPTIQHASLYPVEESKLFPIDVFPASCRRKVWWANTLKHRYTLEELTHHLSDVLGPERALSYTPAYAEFLKASGDPFDHEAYVAAFSEEHLGLKFYRRFVFNHFHSPSRIPYMSGRNLSLIPNQGRGTLATDIRLTTAEGLADLRRGLPSRTVNCELPVRSQGSQILQKGGPIASAMLVTTDALNSYAIAINEQSEAGIETSNSQAITEAAFTAASGSSNLQSVFYLTPHLRAITDKNHPWRGFYYDNRTNIIYSNPRFERQYWNFSDWLYGRPAIYVPF